MQMAGTRVASLTDLAERLAGPHPYARFDVGVDCLEVRAVITNAVIATDRHRQPTPRRARVDRPLPLVDPGHLEHDAAGRGDDLRPARREDVGGRIVVVYVAVAVAADDR